MNPFLRWDIGIETENWTKGHEIWNIADSNYIKDTLTMRLQFVRQIYTCMFEASLHHKNDKSEGGLNDQTTCFDPLFFHFPQLEYAYKGFLEQTDFISANTFKVSISE